MEGWFKQQLISWLTMHGKPYFLLPDVLKRWSFQKNCTGISSFLYYLERWGVFFPKPWHLFFGRRMKDDLSQEMHGNMIFPVYMYRCYKHAIMPLCRKKNQRWSSPAKMHLKVIDILEKVAIILCTFMETFTGVSMYCFSMKKNRKHNI